jgi:hypothetical protein
VDAPRCPQCGANDPIDEQQQLAREQDEMAKITVHGGPSNQHAEPGDPGYQAPPEDASPDGKEQDVAGQPSGDTGTDEAEQPEVPDAHAKKADWVDYAVALGHERDVVEGFTKADIVELVGTRSTSAQAETAEGSGAAGDA